MAAHNHHIPKICLLLGVPTDYDTFVSRVITSDWLSKFNPSYLKADSPDREPILRERWTSEYSPLVAEPLLELIKRAEQKRVDVVPEANLDILRQSSETHDIIILFAHWKAYELIPEDLIQPVNIHAFVECAGRNSGATANRLCKRLQELAGVQDRGNSPPKRPWWQLKATANDQLSLPEILSEAISLYRDEAESGHSSVDRILETELTLRSRARDYLDQTFAGLLQPGNRLELFDGLHSKEQVESAVWNGFSGVLDLTTCTSTILADYIANRRRQQLRTIQFPAVQEFLWHAKCIEIALSLVIDHGMSYQQARLVAGSTLAQFIKDVGREHSA